MSHGQRSLIPLTPWTIRGDTLVFASYFVWVSVFNLFVVSVFWGFMADL